MYRRMRDDDHRMCIPTGPLTGMAGVARELMLHLGADPDAHPDVLLKLEQAIGEEMLDTGREILAEHGVPREEV